VTTGGDRVFPRGLPVGTIESFYPDHDREPFMVVKVKPAVNLGRLAEVLVVTELAVTSASAQAEQGADVRAADILAEKLPSIKKKTPSEIAAEEKSVPNQIVSDTVPSGVDTAAVPTDAEGRPLPASATKPTANAGTATQPKTNPASSQPKPASMGTAAPAKPKSTPTPPANGTHPQPQGQPR
jgi:rod shape-determining protein MreC